MKYGFLALVLMAVLTLVLYALPAEEPETSFVPVLEVILEDDSTGELRYQVIGTDKQVRDTECFSSDEVWTHTFSCFDHMGEKDNTIDEEKMTDADREALARDPAVMKMLSHVEGMDHWVMDAKVMHHDGVWYLRTMLNVNLWTPYELYRYVPETDELKELYTFDGWDVVGMRTVEKAR